MAIKITQKQLNLIRFSLGVEEFALILSLMGKGKDGQIIMATRHKDISELDMDALFSSASHSLLARDYCTITSGAKKPKVDKGLKDAVDNLYRYDRVMYLNILAGNEPIQTAIHINSTKSFCAHLNRANKVHLLEHGSIQSLGEYLIDLLEKVIFSSETEADNFNGEIPFSILTRLTIEAERTDVTELENRRGWSKDRIQFLREDLDHQLVRGMILRIETNDVESDSKDAQSSKMPFLFLRGETRVWTFKFDSQEDSAIGIAKMTDRKGFLEALVALAK